MTHRGDVPNEFAAQCQQTIAALRADNARLKADNETWRQEATDQRALRPKEGDGVITSIDGLEMLLFERRQLRAQVAALQSDATARAEASLHRQVRAFHAKFGHPVATTPAVPDVAQVKFRLKLITEEFFELLDACGIDPSSARGDGDGDEYDTDAKSVVCAAIDEFWSTNDVDLPEFVDALGDLSYVIEGTAAAVGVHMPPIMNAIHAANFSKDPTYVAAKDDHHRSPDPTAKPTKPSDWKPPPIAALLGAQGWRKP